MSRPTSTNAAPCPAETMWEDLPVLDRLALHEIDDLACVDRSEQRLARFVVVERVAAPDVLVPPSRDPDLTWILNRVALRFTGSL
jgi:hypothetical protein